MAAVYAGFDMGIRNLAYCVIERSVESSWKILAWDNVDLLEGGESAQTAKSCHGCKGTAKWINLNDGTKWCKACATGVRVKKTATAKPSLPVFPTLLSMNKMADLQTVATSRGIEVKKMKKVELVTWVQKHYLTPWKAVKSTTVSLDIIRRSMNTWLSSVLPTMAKCSVIRLENQPAMKAPTMKSVQIMLYTLLGHRLETEHSWKGRIEFVHAGVKSRSVDYTDISGAAGAYKARKDTAEADVAKLLRGGSGSEWATFFAGRSKKSDLADAFLMAFRV